MTDKLEDPKANAGNSKIDLTLIPLSAQIEEAYALHHGAFKYEEMNWRRDGSKLEMMTYLKALKRHLELLIDGEDFAADSLVSHLGAIKAGCSIIIDATSIGHMIDNRRKKGKGPLLMEVATNKLANMRKYWQSLKDDEVSKQAKPEESIEQELEKKRQRVSNKVKKERKSNILETIQDEIKGLREIGLKVSGDK